ncbi:App1 family protein [Cellulophaga sp. Hel_I_12]|uniref:App1 family protein n=1 Tax=Cellulophaga sp. Hel_I_12 TaxID=1249972 RepID=UPI000647B7E1|nr:phosphatase domain-containing protein [Cellulophaga sp. Hel_I_12]
MSFFQKDPLQIICFDAYGTASHFYLRGRALEDETIDLDKKGWFHLVLNTWKRFESDEIKNIALNISLPNGTVLKTKTDHHGYFKVKAAVDDLGAFANEEGWLSFEVAYDDIPLRRIIHQKNSFKGKILIPSVKANYGVITDIDDTILHTGVVSRLKWKVLYNTVFKTAKNRLPLIGASEFYNQLHLGKTLEHANPIFYVSHSPWNLYRYLDLFLRQNNFPKGPILLRSFQSIFKRKSEGDKPQKQLEILNILDAYPDLGFILIGDSGERDADIYKEIAALFPDRILAIYLRSVNHKRKMTRVKGLFENYKTTPVLFVENSNQAVAHAKALGFI